ncbi:transcriptional regulator [Erwinia sp. OLTSP20]|uniref:sugar metabolism global transcriptional regulator Mlc n=1 Tax=unclassified Erwinia TaxID=2622719 RepID=UPI000C1A00D9|nr:MULTISPECIES: ROK family transcriptional regulator [unclassified Erwinia]PIJ51693.1 transcriptional regulator [Erwinia sp. OAMSP11]PIJ75580.1 transcriptional regulator [Erwinia sp. OLSSP12]PIJ84885.1 transcriptional regulator [Erwinia sp. OLCASP19]PIJ86664.1 transcriptional regulator [Erwinia sp. OLMTSP26]PIJ88105.1 transcriptional regulator [Erwinia sp. OLMDSP33]
MLGESQPGHIDQIKKINAGVVYRLIDQHGPISRIELSKKAQLAPASITKIVREMIDAQLVTETEFQEMASRGRPATGLIVASGNWHYLALRIGNGELIMALRDLASRCIIEESRPLPVDDVRPLQFLIAGQIDAFFLRHHDKLARLTAITITAPGRVNASLGIIHSMPFYPVNEMPLASFLSSRIGLPVFLAHDIYGWTLAEALFGAARGGRDVIHLVIDDNVGAGVITGGRILHAGGASQVEIGHIQLNPQGRACYCGNQGCLETLASVPYLLDEAAQQLRDYPDSLLHQQLLTVGALCQAAQCQDPLARQLISDVGQRVGGLLAVMVNIFHPEKIVIASPLNQAAAVLYPAIRRAISQQALSSYGDRLQLEASTINSAGTLAAAALVKEALFEGSLLIQLLQG